MATAPGRSFRSLWIASTSGGLADGLAATTLPLLIVGITRNPVMVSLLQVASGLPWLLLGLHAGVLSDRWDRKRLMWSADLFRTVVVLAVVGLVLVNATSVPAILAAAFLYGAATVVFRSAAPAMLPQVVGDSDLTKANSQLQTGTTITGSLLGPSLGSVTYAFAAWVPLLTQASALAVSVAALRRLPQTHRPERADPRSSMQTEIADGLRWIVRDPTLRALSTATGLLAASTGMLLAVLVLHVVDTLDSPPSSYGILFTLYAIGGLAVSAAVPRVQARWGTRTSLSIAAAVGAISVLAVAWGTTVVYTAAGMATLGMATMLYNIIAVTVRQQRTPDHLLGRVSSAFNVLSVGSLPPAALAAGLLTNWYGTRTTLTIASGLCVAAFISITFWVPRRQTPQPLDQPPAGPDVSRH